MFPSLPDSARVWIFAASRALSPVEQQDVLKRLQPFLAGWRSHGRPVPAEARFQADRLLVVGAHIEDGLNAGVSGCGIDALTHAVEAAGASDGIEWLGGMHVLYRTPAGELRAVSRPEFRQQVKEGAITPDTLVADTTIGDLETLRQQGIERPISESWHARVFRVPTAA